MGFAQTDGVEPALIARARAARHAVIGLETPEAQLRIFDNLPETDARALLDATVDDLKTMRDDTNALVAYWQAGEDIWFIGLLRSRLFSYTIFHCAIYFHKSLLITSSCSDVLTVFFEIGMNTVSVMWLPQLKKKRPGI